MITFSDYSFSHFPKPKIISQKVEAKFRTEGLSLNVHRQRDETVTLYLPMIIGNDGNFTFFWEKASPHKSTIGKLYCKGKSFPQIGVKFLIIIMIS